MGYTSDFIGHVEVTPRLGEAEQLYLTAFSASRRWDRPGGPYEVPANPYAERDSLPADLDRYNSTHEGQPSLWCGWVPCWDGCCLAHDGGEKFYGSTRWLQYLIDHFLKPGARAAQTGLDCFSEFTFDHVLDGIVAACRRDTRELYLIRVENNRVFEETLRPADPDFFDAELLPYEKVIDKLSERRKRRKRPRLASAE